MVVSADTETDTPPAMGDLSTYLKDMGLQLAALSAGAGRPEAALHFLRAAIAVGEGKRQPAEKAAPAAAT